MSLIRLSEINVFNIRLIYNCNYFELNCWNEARELEYRSWENDDFISIKLMGEL